MALLSSALLFVVTPGLVLGDTEVQDARAVVDSFTAQLHNPTALGMHSLEFDALLPPRDDAEPVSVHVTWSSDRGITCTYDEHALLAWVFRGMVRHNPPHVRTMMLDDMDAMIADMPTAVRQDMASATELMLRKLASVQVGDPLQGLLARAAEAATVQASDLSLLAITDSDDPTMTHHLAFDSSGLCISDDITSIDASDGSTLTLYAWTDVPTTGNGLVPSATYQRLSRETRGSKEVSRQTMLFNWSSSGAHVLLESVVLTDVGVIALHKVSVNGNRLAREPMSDTGHEAPLGSVDTPIPGIADLALDIAPCRPWESSGIKSFELHADTVATPIVYGQTHLLVSIASIEGGDRYSGLSARISDCHGIPLPMSVETDAKTGATSYLLPLGSACETLLLDVEGFPQVLFRESDISPVFRADAGCGKIAIRTNRDCTLVTGAWFALAIECGDARISAVIDDVSFSSSVFRSHGLKVDTIDGPHSGLQPMNGKFKIPLPSPAPGIELGFDAVLSENCLSMTGTWTIEARGHQCRGTWDGQRVIVLSETTHDMDGLHRISRPGR